MYCEMCLNVFERAPKVVVVRCRLCVFVWSCT